MNTKKEEMTLLPTSITYVDVAMAESVNEEEAIFTWTLKYYFILMLYENKTIISFLFL